MFVPIIVKKGSRPRKVSEFDLFHKDHTGILCSHTLPARTETFLNTTRDPQGRGASWINKKTKEKFINVCVLPMFKIKGKPS